MSEPPPLRRKLAITKRLFRRCRCELPEMSLSSRRERLRCRREHFLLHISTFLFFRSNPPSVFRVLSPHIAGKNSSRLAEKVFGAAVVSPDFNCRY
nr:hypothetical protein [Tanacetum cinerariifolium]